MEIKVATINNRNNKRQTLGVITKCKVIRWTSVLTSWADTKWDEFKYWMYHTGRNKRKELEDADFGWMFDCEGVEVKEVE